MTLITKAQTEPLLANGIAQRAAIDRQDQALDFKPVVKLFTPDAQCTWLLTEIDEGNDDATLSPPTSGSAAFHLSWKFAANVASP